MAVFHSRLQSRRLRKLAIIAVQIRRVDAEQIASGLVLPLNFCASSVDLWCSFSSTRHTRQALVAEERGSTFGLALYTLCECSTGPRVYVTHLESGDHSSAEALLAEIDQDVDFESSESVTAFVEINDPISSFLPELGWKSDRRFPVQFAWTDLGKWQPHIEPDNARANIEISSDADLVAGLFVEAFIDDWSWYFDELGYRPAISSNRELHAVARNYVSRATALFVAWIDGDPVGLSSAITNKIGGLGEFHTGVGVLPRARGNRAGERLVEFTLQWLRQAGMTQAEVRTQSVGDSLNPNLKMYTECGGQVGLQFSLFAKIPNQSR